jgi:hypothetical protein
MGFSHPPGVCLQRTNSKYPDFPKRVWESTDLFLWQNISALAQQKKKPLKKTYETYTTPF